MPEILRTFRMVADPQPFQDVLGTHKLASFVAIDVMLRGKPEDVEALSTMVRGWLDYGSRLLGSWVDKGTDRRETTVGVRMDADRCHGCGRRVTRRNRATFIVAGAVGGCSACSGQPVPKAKADRNLEALDALAFLPTREAVKVQRRYAA